MPGLWFIILVCGCLLRAELAGGRCEGLAIKGRFYSLLRHLYMQWGAHAVVDCAREFLLQHGGTLMGYMVMVPTLYMATKGAVVPAADMHGHGHGGNGGVHSHGASGLSRARVGNSRGSVRMQPVHGDHSHGNSMESPLALLFGAGAGEDDHAHGDHGHSHGGVGDIAEMMVANSQLLASLAGSILELSETCGARQPTTHGLDFTRLHVHLLRQIQVRLDCAWTLQSH